MIVVCDDSALIHSKSFSKLILLLLLLLQTVSVRKQ